MRALLLRAAVVGACAASLGGCISLLPKSVPAQLYRFGVDTPVQGGPGRAGARPVGVLLENVYLPRAATADGILAVTGDQAAYIAGARWVSPAVVLFTEATLRSFDARGSRVRLNMKGSAGRSEASLRLSVRDFQADYAQPGAVPTVVVSLHARLTGADGRPLAENDFEVRTPATDNRVGAIVPAFDTAVSEVLTKVVAWTEASAPAADTPSR